MAKIVRCNWKVASEAFMESYHVVGTHPQILLGGLNDTDTKYDVFGNYSRAIRCGALEASGLPEWEAMPDDGRIRAMHPLNGFVYERTDDEQVRVTAPDGRGGLFSPAAEWIEGELTDVSPHLCNWVGGKQLAEGLATMGGSTASPNSTPIPGETRHPMVAMADMQRQALKSVIGERANDIADIEFSSVFLTLFPNFHPWGSFNRINYRFRPNGSNPNECIMECIYLAPIPDDGNFEPCRAIHWLGVDDDWTEAPELGFLAKVFNQDFRNLPYVQQGLHASGRGYVQFADYNETKPRHFHQLLEEWIGRD